MTAADQNEVSAAVPLPQERILQYPAPAYGPASAAVMGMQGRRLLVWLPTGHPVAMKSSQMPWLLEGLICHAGKITVRADRVEKVGSATRAAKAADQLR